MPFPLWQIWYKHKPQQSPAQIVSLPLNLFSLMARNFYLSLQRTLAELCLHSYSKMAFLCEWHSKWTPISPNKQSDTSWKYFVHLGVLSRVDHKAVFRPWVPEDIWGIAQLSWDKAIISPVFPGDFISWTLVFLYCLPCQHLNIILMYFLLLQILKSFWNI